MFVEREPDGGAAQMAWGIEIEADLPFSTDRMRWMDFSPTHGEADGPSTFLYAMPLGERRWFLEETSLSSDPPVPMVVLERRLRARLRALGVGSPQVLSEERCRIPMEPGLPARGQRVVGFGAAASVVHPATGYVLASAALMADPVAAAIEEGLWRDPDQAARDAWHAVWPDEARRAHTLLRFAARFMRELDAPRTAAFFEQFFQLPPERWRRFLSARPRTAELVPVMASVFSGVDADLRWRMLRAGSGSSALPILRSVAGL
jgi:lycopene beta-cyclase